MMNLQMMTGLLYFLQPDSSNDTNFFILSTIFGCWVHVIQILLFDCFFFIKKDLWFEQWGDYAVSSLMK